MADARQIGREIRDALSKTIRDAMLLAADSVTNATPVDTTHASNNWILSVGRPYTEIDGTREAPSSTAQEAGIQRIQEYDIGRDGPIFLRNNVLYVQFLDRGWSQQAPPGFVAAALAGAARRAPHGRKQSVRKMLRAMSRAAYIRTY